MAGTREISGAILRADGSPWANAQVQFTPRDDTFTVAPDRTYPENTVTAVADEAGLISLTLASGLSVAYRVTLPDRSTFDMVVPDGGPISIEALRAAYAGFPPDAPPDLETALLAALANPSIQSAIDHENLDNHGVFDHADIDAHLGADSDVHGVSGPLVGRNEAATLTDKTLGPGTRVALGGDGAGDVWYRDGAGNLTRLPVGANGQVLKVSAGLPAWGTDLSGSGGGGGDIEVQEGGVAVVAVATALDFAGADFNVTDGGGGRAVVALAGGGGGGGLPGSGDVTFPAAIKVAMGDPSAAAALLTGTKAFVEVPWACTLTGWSVLADQATATTLDVWRDVAGNHPPTDADRIAGTEKPTLSGAARAADFALATWATSLSAQDVLGIEVEANTAARYLELTLYVERTVLAQFTAEDAQDAVGAILADTGSVDLAYDDAGNQITAAVKYAGSGGAFGTAQTAARSDHHHDAAYAPAGHDHSSAEIDDFAEAAQDAVGGIVLDTATVNATYDDAAPSLSFAVVDNTSVQKVRVARNGVLAGTRREINLIEGANVTLSAADDAANDRVNVTVNSTGGGGGGSGIATKEANATVSGTTLALDFDGTAFNLTDEGGGEVAVALNLGTGAGQPAAGNHTHAAAAVTDFAEAAQDAVGAALTDSTSIDFTYTDGSNQITAAVIYGGSGGLSGTAATAARSDHDHDATLLTGFTEGVRDVVGATLQAGTGLTKTVNDALDTTTLAADVGTGAGQVAAGNHTHTAATIADFAEATDDRVAALLTVSAPLTKTYADAANNLALGVSVGTAAGTVAAGDHAHASSLTLTGALKFVVGDASAATPISTGAKAYLYAPFACTITGWVLLADQSTTTTLDVWRDAYANHPPTDADRIAGTEKPATSAANRAENAAVSTWTTAVSAGDVLAVEVEANTNARFLELSVLYQRTLAPTVT